MNFISAELLSLGAVLVVGWMILCLGRGCLVFWWFAPCWKCGKRTWAMHDGFGGGVHYEFHVPPNRTCGNTYSGY